MTQVTQTIQKDYKKTEIGVIPADWDLVPLGKLCNYQNGTALERYFNNASGLKVISIGNYSETGKFVETGSYIDRKYIKDLKKFVLDKNDLTMILNDKTAVGTIIGRVLYIEKNDEYIFNQRTMRLTTKDNTDSLFLYFQINGGKTHKYIVNLSKPGTQIYVNTNDITELPIATPRSKPEQTAIATALSDADALIENMKKMIAKKKAIKQGAMQQLLTGKKRMSGFSGDWTAKKLKEIGEIITGSTPPTKISEYWNGLIPWVTPTDISVNKNISNSERKISVAGLQISRKLPKNTLLVTCIASIGKNAILRKEGACNQQINAIIPNSSNDVDFIYYLIEINKQYLLGNAGITATLIISKKDFSEIEFKIPESKEEQTAIATVLSDMDIEIEKLEKKLNKYRQIKTGMMQQLLTGKIRLVKN